MANPYFIGVALPVNLSEHIKKAQHALRPSDSMIFPKQPHITLLHPHMLSATTPDDVIPRVRTIADKHLPLEIKLTTIDCFDKRVLHIVAKSLGLNDLYRELLSILPPDMQRKHGTARPYRPHVTIAKTKPKHELPTHLITQFQKEISPILPATFTTTHLTHFKWTHPQTYELHLI